MKKMSLLFSTVCLSMGLLACQQNSADTRSQADLSNSEEEMTKEEGKVSAINELKEIQKAIDKTYGSTGDFEKEGTLFFDEDGNAIFLMKANKANLEKISELELEIKQNVKNDDKIFIKESKYSTDDLVKVRQSVMNTLLEYDRALVIDGKVELSLSLTKQELVLKSKEELPKNLGILLSSNYGDVLEFKITDELIIPEEENGFYDQNDLDEG